MKYVGDVTSSSGRACSTHGRDENLIHNFGRETRMKETTWKDLDIHRRIILEWILQKYGRMLRTWHMSQYLNGDFGFQNGKRIFWLAERLSVSEEGFCYMMLVYLHLPLHAPVVWWSFFRLWLQTDGNESEPNTV